MSQLAGHWMNLLRCPGDGNELRDEGSHLTCAGCQTRYPVEDGLVQFVSSGSFDDDRKEREMHARDADATSYDEMFDRTSIAIEVPPSLAALNPMRQDVVAEFGAGTGRFSRLFIERIERLVALDFSYASLAILRKRLTPAMRERTLLVQADACKPPLLHGAFSKVVSYGMLQHLPQPAMRQAVVQSASNLLRSGGTFTATMYNWSKHKQMIAARKEGDYGLKEGTHDSGIYYYNFEEPELRQMWTNAGLRVDKVYGIQIGFRGARFMGPLEVLANRMFATTAWGIARSHQLLVRGVKS